MCSLSVHDFLTYFPLYENVAVAGDHLVAVGGRHYDMERTLHHRAFRATNVETLNSAEWYDCRNDCWVKTSEMPLHLYGHASASYQGNLYISGGRNTEATNALLCYNVQSNSWSSCPSMHQQRYYHSMVETKNKLFVIGGIDYDVHTKGWNFLQDIECFNLETQQWCLVAPIPHRRSQAGVATYGDIIYVIGGLPFPGVDGRHQVLEYNVVKNQWQISGLRYPAFWPTVCCILRLPPELYS